MCEIFKQKLMRKITLFLGLVLVTALNYAQGTPDPESLTISFESSEGYSLGSIHNQDNWTATGDGQGNFLQGQVVSDDRASDGNFSFKLTQEDAFGPQDLVMGGFYAFDDFVDANDVTISFDMYISAPGLVSNGSRYRFGISGTGLDDNGMPQPQFLHFVDFAPNGDILGIDTEELVFEDIDTYSFGTWFNVRLEYNNNTLEYYVDDNLVFTDDFLNPLPEIEGFRFVHNNDGETGSPAYVDNIRFNDETLSIGEFAVENNFIHYVKNDMLNLQSTTQLKSIDVYDVAGKSVIKTNLDAQSNAKIDVNSLNQGVYVARLNTESGVHTFKFAK